jgi:hypothetical protein
MNRWFDWSVRNGDWRASNRVKREVQENRSSLGLGSVSAASNP